MALGKITIEEVARQASVSIATVSRILNNKGPVAKKTRNKVLLAMEQLDFKFQPLSLATAGSNVILMCIPELGNPFYSAILEGAQKAAQNRNYYIFLVQTRDFNADFSEYEEILKTNQVAGLLLLSPVHNAEIIETLSFRCPVVMCSEYYEGDNISFVSIDDIGAAKKAVRYLVATGRKRIAFLNSTLEYRWARHRESGFREAMQEVGLPVREDWVLHLSGINFSLAVPNANSLLDKDDPPDAVFAVSDVYAAAVIKAARKCGLRVPEDLSVIGFDNTDLSLITDPSITTIRQPSYEIGYQACELLIDKIVKPQAMARQIILDTDLIIRDSTML